MPISANADSVSISTSATFSPSGNWTFNGIPNVTNSGAYSVPSSGDYFGAFTFNSANTNTVDVTLNLTPTIGTTTKPALTFTGEINQVVITQPNLPSITQYWLSFSDLSKTATATPLASIRQAA